MGRRILTGVIVALCLSWGCSRPGAPTPAFVTLDVENPGGGTVEINLGGQRITCEGSCSASLRVGTSVRLVAHPTTGTFQGWGGAGPGCGTDARCDIAVSTDLMVQARFTHRLTVNVSGAAAAGRVTSAGGNIDCPGMCEADILVGTPVTLTASSTAAFFFGWTDECSSAGSELICDVTPEANATIGARFEYYLLQGAGGTGNDAAHAVAVDPTLAGAHYVAGSYDSTDLQLVPTSGALPFEGGTDMYVARVLPGGGLDWVHTFRGTGSVRPYALSVDVEQNQPVVYVAGAFTGSINFGMGTVDPAGDPNGFVVKLDAFGTVWARDVIGATVISGVAPSPNLPEVFVAGFVELTADFGNGITVDTTNQNRHHLLIGRYDTTGVPQAASLVGRGGNSHTEATGIIVDPGDNHPILVGTSQTAWDNGASCSFSPTSQFDGFVIKMDRGDFDCVWDTPIEAGGSDMASALALSPTTVFVGGSSTNPDLVFLGSYDLADGSEVFLNTFPSTDVVAIPGLAYDAVAAGPVMAGGFSGTVTIGATNLTSNGGDDLFIARFDTNGNEVSAVSFGGAMGDTGGGPADMNIFDDNAPTFRDNYATTCVATTPTGAALIAGRSGSPSFPVVDAYAGKGGDDLFILHAAPIP